MHVPLFQVDAFTAEPFAGNPAAVCLLDSPADPKWMQAVAAEMNLAETAFVVPTGDRFGLRWFTPTVEVDLCGHATLAAAHVLWERGERSPTVRFDTRSGELACTRAADGWIAMDFPADPPELVDAPPGLFDGLGLPPVAVRRGRFDYLVEMPTVEVVRAVSPDFRRLAAIDARGVIVTAAGGGPGVDFVSRFFAPAVGVDEDPVTGSAHCCLAVHWAARLGRTGELVARQLSRRGGVVRCEARGKRVRLGGQAVTVVAGTLTADASAVR